MHKQSLVRRFTRRLSVVSTAVAATSAVLVVTSASPVLGDTGCPTAVAPALVSGSYEIDTAAKLQWLRESVSVSGAMSNSYKVTANINMSGCTWTVGIGSTSTPFSGTFDGNNKTISNLTINNTSSHTGIALFRYLTGTLSDLTLASPSVTGTSNHVAAFVGEVRSGATITNLTATGVSISGGQQTGGAFGRTAGGSTVQGVTVSGTVSAPSGVGGGVVGSAEGPMSGLTSTATVTGDYYLGGLAGMVSTAGALTNSSSSGNVTGSSSVGGAAGLVSGTSPTCGTLTSVTTSGSISGTSQVGGLIGYVDCYSVVRSSSSATVTATSIQVGGLVGYENIRGSITGSYFTGQVQGSEQVGGIAGASRSTITDTYSSGTVTATASPNGGRAGGLVGWLLNGAVLTRTYATGSVTAPASGSPTVGGLIGYYTGGTISSSGWDTQTTGQTTSGGTGANGYTTQQMRDYVLYDSDNLNWPITNGVSPGNGVSTGTTWSICSGTHGGYPFLTWSGYSGTCRPTMAYNGNGHTGGTQPSDPTTPYTSGSTVTVLGNTGSLTKTSRIFSGWNTKADGTGLAYVSGDTFSITVPVMLFAVWTTTPAVVYGANGGSGTASVTTGASGSTVTLGTGSGLTKSGFTLSRWDTASAGNGISYTLGQSITMPAGGLVLYAVWTPAAPTTTTTAAPATTSPTTTVAASAPTTVASGGASTPTVTTSTTTPSTSAGQSSTSPGVVTPTTAAQTGASAGSGSSSAAASTTTTIANTTSTTAAPPSDAPDVDGVSVGEVGATVAGRPATAKVDTVDGSLIVEVGGGVIKYSVKGEDGAARAIAQGEQIFLRAGDTVRVDFAGFAAQAESSAWLSPGKMLLGTTRLENGAGFVEGVVDGSAPEGDRRIAVATESADGDPVVVAYGVSIAEGESSGTSWSVLLLVIVGLAVVGGLLIPAARRRRDEENA